MEAVAETTESKELRVRTNIVADPLAGIAVAVRWRLQGRSKGRNVR